MAKFFMKKVPDLRGKGEKKLYPKMVHAGVKKFNDLTKEINDCTTFSEADIIGAVTALSSALAENMSEGYSVKIDGLGTFSPSLSLLPGVLSETVDSEKQHNGLSVKVGNVNFLADKKFVSLVNSKTHLERTKAPISKTEIIKAESQRLEKLQEYLKENAFINVLKYQELTGLSHFLASKELQSFCQDFTKGIVSKGHSSHKVYVLS